MNSWIYSLGRKAWAGLLWIILLFYVAACNPGFYPEKNKAESVESSHTNALQSMKTSIPFGNEEFDVSNSLPPLPQRRTQVRFERVVDAFSREITSPSEVMQDRYGFIWIATVDGLVRYDGYQYKKFKHNPDQPDSLSSNQVTAVKEDHLGILWVGTDGGGLNRFDRTSESFTHFRQNYDQPGSLSNDRINVIFEDSLGELWIGTAGGGLNRLDRSSQNFIYYKNNPEQPGSLSSNTVYAIYEDNSADLWIGTNNGLDHYDRSTERFHRYQHDPQDPESLSHNSVYAILGDEEGVLWLGTYGGGLNRMDVNKGSFIRYRYDPKDPTSISSDIVTALEIDRGGMLWVGTMGGGLSRLDPRTRNFTRYLHQENDSNSPSSSYINFIFEDRAAILWVSTARTLDKFDPYKEKFTQQFRQDHVTVIYENRVGNLWVGAFDGLYQYDRAVDQVVHYRHDPEDHYSLSEWRVTAIAEDRFGNLWVGTAGGGLNRFESSDQRFYRYRFDIRDPGSIPSDSINVIYIDQDDNLWVGTDHGLSRYDRPKNLFAKLPLSTNYRESGGAEIVRAILEDQDGALWIGTEGGGLKRFDESTGEITTFRHKTDSPSSLRNNVIYALFEDSGGELWVGTEGGLHRFNRQTETFQSYGVQAGLPDDEIYAILEDHHGNLWMSTDHGLSKFNPETGVFRNYDAGDGLQGDQFSSAAFRRRNGEMMFGGVNGISAFFPTQISDNPNLPPVVLLALRQYGQSLQLEQPIESLRELTLSGGSRDLEFEFAALSYSQPERNQHAYMLEGFDTEWNYLGTERVGRYTNLPGGIYTLHLKGANDDGVWNEEGLAINLTVVPPFWETTWFWGILGLMVVGVVFSGYRLRVRSIEARNRELETQITERTVEIERRRKELEALYLADETMHRHLNLDPLLHALVKVAVEILRADKGAVYVPTSGANHSLTPSEVLSMRVGIGMPPGCRAFQTGFAAWLTGLDKPAYVYDGEKERTSASVQGRLAKKMLDEGIRSWIFLPIELQGRFFGVFTVCYRSPYAFGENDVRLLQALVQRASLAIENAHLYENAQELAVIKERNRLARDLHDSVKQKTFAALAQIGASRRLVTGQPERASICMQEAEQLVHDVLQELVSLIQELYPIALQEHGLEDAMRSYAAQWAHQTDIQINLNIQGGLRLSPQIEQSLYRIFQEALTNIARHGNADCVQVNLVSNLEKDVGPDGSHTIHLDISDDGCGFDTDRVITGVGLRSMRERVESLNGLLNIISQPGRGTRIEVSVSSI